MADVFAKKVTEHYYHLSHIRAEREREREGKREKGREIGRESERERDHCDDQLIIMG